MSPKWTTATLDEVFEIGRGGSPRPIDDYYTDDPTGINWIMIGDTMEGSKYIESTRKRIHPSGVAKSRAVKPGDFLLTNSMSFGRPYISKLAGCIHDGWLVLSPRNGNADPNYFYYLLGSPEIYSEFARLAAGAIVKNLNIDLVKGVSIPLPPLAEQRRLADILDAADSIRQMRRSALSLIKQFSNSIFIEMFGDPTSNPRRWARSPLSAICRISSSLVDPRLPEFADLPHYGSDRIEKDSGHLMPAKSARHDGVESGKFVFDADCILYSKIRPYLNKVALAEGRGLCSADIYPIQVQDDLVDRIYLWTLLRSQDFLSFAESFSNRANIPKLNREQLMAYAAMLPPIQLQQRFSSLQVKIFESEKLALRSLAKIEDVFLSLQSRAFRGEL